MIQWQQVRIISHLGEVKIGLFGDKTMQKNRQNQKRKHRGMTLVEIMIVLVILVSVLGLAIVAFQGQRSRANVQTTFAYIQTLAQAIERYETNVGRYPTTEQGLAALVAPPGDLINPASWAGPYITATASSRDPWGNEYQYISPGRDGRAFDLWSFGPDGIDGTEDDIGSWMPHDAFR